MAFEINKTSNFDYYNFSESSLKHGFIGSSLDFSKGLETSSKELLSYFNAKTLCLLDQVHGSEIAIANTENPIIQADAWIIKDYASVQGLVFGIKTADCLAILIESEDSCALVHAGWRGLAAGIIQRCLEHFDPDNTKIFVGPAAGEKDYEVGQEVIDAIGVNAVFKKSRDKFLLDLPSTCQKIASSQGFRHFYSSGISTISNTDWHSHRRSQKLAGRNLMFVKF